MARTRSFVVFRGLLTLSLLVCSLLKPDAFASAHIHSPSQDDTGEIHHRLIKRSALAQRRNNPDSDRRWSSIPRDHVADEALEERSGDQPNATGPNNVFERINKFAVASAWDGPTEYQQLGTSGVAAMQLSVVTDRYVIIFDRAEQNPLTTSDGVNAWSVLLDTQEHTVRALKVKTNSFCAGQ